MLFDRKEKRQLKPEYSEDDIQDEIRRRILRESSIKSGIEESRESTKATLDALEGMVPLSREEMERIAEQVRTEFEGNEESKDNKEFKKNKEPVKRSRISWTIFVLIPIAYFLARRGSPWSTLVGLILIFAIINYFFRSPPSNKNDSNP